jgi:predicted HD phosphohydrolase
MKKVSFTEMKNGNKEDYQLLEKYEKDFERKTADRIIKYLAAQTSTLEGYQITRLEHSLQAATRAYKNGESEEMVVATLLHDIGRRSSSDESLSVCSFNIKTLCF